MTTLVPSFLDESSSFLQVTSTTNLNEFEFCHCFKLELPTIELHKLWSFQSCWQGAIVAYCATCYSCFGNDFFYLNTSKCIMY